MCRKNIRLCSVIFYMLFLVMNTVYCVEKKTVKFPKSINSLNGSWTWDWGNGKTAFVIKRGTVSRLPISFELKKDILHAKFLGSSTVDLSFQPDGSWKGVEFPSKRTIVMKRVDLGSQKIPKTLKSLDGKWTWWWHDGTHLFEIIRGKWNGASKPKLQLKKDILSISFVGSGNHIDLVLQPDGNWIGIESPTLFKCGVRKTVGFPSVKSSDKTKDEKKDKAVLLLPEPQKVLCLKGLIPLGTHMVCVSCRSKNLRNELKEIATEWGLQFTDRRSGAPSIEITISYGDRKDAAKLVNELGEQGYSLKIFQQPLGASIQIRGGDKAGAFHALQTLRQLLVRKNGKSYIKPVKIKDWPSIKRRGLIFGVGKNKDQLIKDLQFCSRFKLNFFQDCRVNGAGRTVEELRKPVAETDEFCKTHFIEHCGLLGGKDTLDKLSIKELLEFYMNRYKAGLRTFTVNFDDAYLADKEETANRHVKIINSIYEHLKKQDRRVQFIVCPIPYGGRPDKTLCWADFECGINYLSLLGEKIPKDVPFFWTGDESVWSTNVTVEGAQKYGGLIKRKPFMWDNNPIRFANGNKPLTGRELKLYTQLSGYVANLNEGETRWDCNTENVQLTLLTIAMFTWNPTNYDPVKAYKTAKKYLEQNR